MEKDSQNCIKGAEVYPVATLLNCVTSRIAGDRQIAQAVWIQGRYRAEGKKSYNGVWFDKIADEYGSKQITAVVRDSLRKRIMPGSVVRALGNVEVRPDAGDGLNLVFNVGSIEESVEQTVDEGALSRAAVVAKKLNLGYKRVDDLLESLLLKDQRPKVALLYAGTSDTDLDFKSSMNLAGESINFTEERVSFTQQEDLCAKLVELDNLGYDIIAIVRGGGSNLENLDEVQVLETVTAMKTPTIAAIGHVAERIAFKQVVDKEVPTPTGLGQYFSETVERVTRKKNNSEAAVSAKYEKMLKEKQSEVDRWKKDFDRCNSLHENYRKKAEDSERKAIQAQAQMQNLNFQLELAQKNRIPPVAWIVGAAVAGLVFGLLL